MKYNLRSLMLLVTVACLAFGLFYSGQHLGYKRGYHEGKFKGPSITGGTVILTPGRDVVLGPSTPVLVHALRIKIEKGVEGKPNVGIHDMQLTKGLKFDDPLFDFGDFAFPGWYDTAPRTLSAMPTLESHATRRW